MLVLSRKPNESIQIGDDITVNITRVRGDKVTVAIDAPRDVRVLRSEIATADPTSSPVERNDHVPVCA